jgi:DNA-binding NarL/FixJ family response regulator
MIKRITIYEDNSSLRKGLGELLQLTDEFAVVSTYENCLDVAAQVKNDKPDIVLMDIDMPGQTGIEAVRIIRSFNKEVFIIMLTVFDDSTHVFDAICAGASGYLLKKNVSEKLIPSIKEVTEGGAPMSPSVAKMVINSMQHAPNAKAYNFTDKEKSILSLLCKGNSYKMIADETGYAFETIRSYIKKIYEKLQVHSATEAVSKAITERLV